MVVLSPLGPTQPSHVTPITNKSCHSCDVVIPNNARGYFDDRVKIAFIILQRALIWDKTWLSGNFYSLWTCMGGGREGTIDRDPIPSNYSSLKIRDITLLILESPFD